MKKLIPALLIGAAAIAGCKKDNQSSIIGKWKLDKTDIVLNDANGNVLHDTTLVNTNVNGYIQFNSNGTGISTVGSAITIGAPTASDINAGSFTYQLSGSALTINFAQSTNPLNETLELNNNELKISEKINQSSNGITINAGIVQYYSK